MFIRSSCQSGGFIVALLVWFLLSGCLSFGQEPHQQATVTVVDQKTREPVPFAHVCLEGIKSGTPKYFLTSVDGTFINPIREPVKMAISYVGYTTFADTLMPGQSRIIELRPSILNMDEVVVTAQYTPEKADKSIYKIGVINSQQISMKAANNMADLLKDQTSMRVTQDGVLGTSLRIQGLSGENVKFLQDGVPLIGRMNGNFDLNQISLYNVDHIEVIEGPMSVIYGSNALAGVVNIITQENKTSAISVASDAYYESVGQYNFDLSVSSSLKKHGLAFSGGRNFFDGYSLADTSRSMTFKPRRQYFFDGYYRFAQGPIRIKLSGDYFNELLLDKGPLLPPYYETAFDNNFTTIRYSGRLDGSMKLFSHHFVNVLGSWSGYGRIRQTVFKDLTTLRETNVNESWAQDTTLMKAIVGRVTFSRNNTDSKFNYQAGIDANYETGSGKKIQGDFQEIGDYAAFLSVRWDPFHRLANNAKTTVLSVQPGVRFIYNTKYQAPLVYALSVKWNIFGDFNLRASYSKGFRSPSIKELYLSFVDINHDISGNPDLKAEKSDNVNLSFAFQREHNKVAWTADLTLFYNFLRNQITLAQVGSSSITYIYQNVSRFRSTGIQAGFSYAHYPSFRLQFGFGFTGISGAATDESTFSPWQWSPDLTVSPSYRFAIPDLTLALYYKYTGKAPQLSIDGDDLTYLIIDPYNTMDFTVTKGFWDSRIKLSAGVKNIFNTTTVPSSGASGGGHSGGGGDSNISWGRTVFAKLSVQINKYR